MALELAHRGVAVELFERRPAAMEGASRHCEGKLHLGFVYAADDSLRSARLMARGAGAFMPALRRWIGAAADALPVSQAFHYAVHRDSLHTPDELEVRYGEIARLAREHVAAGAHPGERRPEHLERADDERYGPDVAAVFRTGEVSVHPDALADALAAAVAEEPRVTLRTGARVEAVDRPGGRLRLPDGWSPRFAHIVNCAWDGRLALDASAGVAPPGPWSFRMKYFVRLVLAPGSPAPPDTTIVLGPFGDVVDLGGGDLYLSWYPASRRGWSEALEPPAWPEALAGEERAAVLDGVAAGLEGVLPGAAAILRDQAEQAAVRGGVIYALGTTDVADPESELHERRRVGPVSRDGYHTVDTGKRTLAPLFALELADRLVPHG